jgi:molecular chaperone GrpE
VAQAPGDAPPGFVLEVAQPGFVIGDRVLRAASVIVSTGPGAKGAPSTDDPKAHLDTEA